MGASEFCQWAAFLEVEPVGGMRDDLHTAMLMTLLANVNRDRKKHPQPFKLEEFLSDWWKAQAAPTGNGAAILAKFKMLTG